MSKIIHVDLAKGSDFTVINGKIVSEAIHCAAIQYKLKSNPKEIQYVTGNTHADCIAAFSIMDILRRDRTPEDEISGFMTTRGRFVDRFEALKIAKDNNQIPASYNKDRLYSEWCEYR